MISKYNSCLKQIEISDKTKYELLNCNDSLFKYLINNIEETGISEIIFNLPDIEVRRETRRYLIYDYNLLKTKYKNTLTKSSYFPIELKKEFISKIKETARENGYFLKAYYNPKNIQKTFQSSYQPIVEEKYCHNIKLTMFTKEKFVEKLKEELKEFINLYNYSINSLENNKQPCFEAPEELLTCELYRILDYYEDLPELYDILEEYGIEPVKNKVFLRKI